MNGEQDPDTGNPLLERDAELSMMRDAVSGVVSGRPSTVVVKGRTGLGRTALLRWAGLHAVEAGCRLVVGKCGAAEAEQPASLLATVHGGRSVPEARRWQETLDEPTLLVLDDVQWIDEQSAHWLALLIKRAADAPLSLVLAMSHPSRWPWHDVLVERTPVPARVHRLRPLTPAAVRDLVERRVQGPVDERLVATAVAATYGCPGVLHETLGAMPQSWDAWNPKEFTVRATAAAADRVVRLLDRLPGELAELLRAIAVAGRDLDAQLLGRLAGLRTMSATKALGLLQETEVLARGRRPKLAGSTAQRVLAAMDVGHRETMYTRAATLGYRAAIPEDSLARLLLPSHPVGAQWAIDVLRREASRARTAGDHRRAAALSARALREPSEPGNRARLQIELALAEMPDAPQAADRRLVEVLLSPSGPKLTQVRLHAADLLLGKGNEELVRHAASTVGSRAETSEKERCTLAALYWLADDAPHDAPELSVPAVPPLPENPRCPHQAGVVAWQLAVRGTDPERARSLALAALADTGLLLSPKIQACRTLMLTGDDTTAMAGLDQVVATARECDAGPLIAMSLVARGKLHARNGGLDDAEADLAGALAQFPRHCWHPLMLPCLASLEALLALERGEPDRAGQVLDGPWQPAARHAFGWTQLLLTHGVARLLAGRPEEALDDFQECGRRMLARQWTNPALLAWRSMAAIALRALGRTEEAGLLAGEEIRLAKAWGVPAVIGGAYLGAAMATQGDEAERHGTEAVRFLRVSSWRVRYVFALIELAALKVQSGTTAEAIPLLHEARRLAADLGALQHIRRVQEIAGQVVAMLSPVERRIVEVTARGSANAAIAEQLSVTRRTVEAHLTSIYRKAGLAGRADLLDLCDLLGLGGDRDVVGA